MSESPLLWYLNRSTGVVLVVVLSLAVALGVLALHGRAAGDGGARIPRFVTQALHRNLALGALALLLVHVVTAVLDTYVDIRWWNALVPWGGSYRPVALALGTLSLDLMLAVAVTTAVRSRLGRRGWKVVHLAAWPAWVAGVAHGVLIGTDLGSPRTSPPWALGPTALGVGVVVLAAAHRVLARPRPGGPPVTASGPARLPDAASPR